MTLDTADARRGLLCQMEILATGNANTACTDTRTKRHTRSGRPRHNRPNWLEKETTITYPHLEGRGRVLGGEAPLPAARLGRNAVHAGRQRRHTDVELRRSRRHGRPHLRDVTSTAGRSVAHGGRKTPKIRWQETCVVLSSHGEFFV